MSRVVIGCVVLSLSFAARAGAQCIDCPDDTIPIVDAAGDNSGWCVSISLPENVTLTVVDVDIAGDTATLEIMKDFTGPPGLGFVFSPILMDFFQVCDDAATLNTIVIDSESILNATTNAWTDFDWLLFRDPAGAVAWFDVAASADYDLSPFGTAVFSEFIDPGTNNQALRLTGSNGAIGNTESFFPGAAQGALVIRADTAGTAPVSIALKQRPRFMAIAGDLNLDGDVDLSDFATFSLCFNGPNRGASTNCPRDIDPDLDGDGDVDVADFAMLSRNFTGAR